MRKITKKEVPGTVKTLSGGRFDPLDGTFTFTTEDDIVKLPLHQEFGVTSTKDVTYDKSKLNFVNGFARVLLSNGKFGYVDEDDNLMPYSFDIAFDFNELGFAMVGTVRVGYISEYDFYKNMSELEFRLSYLSFNKIEEYKKVKDISIAKNIGETYIGQNYISFLGEDGKFIHFSQMLNYGNNDDETKVYLNINDLCDYNWNEDGIIYDAENGIIFFIEGYYCTAKDMLYYIYLNGTFPTLNAIIKEDNKVKQKKRK